MHIGIDCRALQEAYPSGVSRYTLGAVRSLVARAAQQNDVVTLFFSGTKTRDALYRKSLVDMLDLGAFQQHVRWKFFSKPNKWLTLKSFFRSPQFHVLFGEVDVVIEPNLQFTPLADDVPIIQVVHDFAFVRMSDAQSLKSLIRHWLLRPQRQLAHATEVVSVSLATFADAKLLFGLSQEKTSVTYPGIPQRSASADKSVQQQVSALSLEKPIILIVGTIEKRKNAPALMSAISLLVPAHPDAQFVFVGKVTPGALRLVKATRQTPRIHIFDYASDDVVAWLYQHATICVYPSLFEGFGFPPLEAQAAGVPVVAGFHSSLPEVLHDSALWCDVLDGRSLARAIQALLTDATLRERYRLAGKQNQQRFSWDRFADRLFEACQRAIRQKPVNDVH